MLPIVMFDIYAYGMVNRMEMTWEECVKQYTKLCWKMVNKYKNIRLEPEERYNLALFGLWKAYQSFDKSRGASFTTHATNLLDLELLRRDQIWFTEKNPETGVSDLYPLDSFSVRKEENIQRGYINGRYGAIPFIRDVDLWLEDK